MKSKSAITMAMLVVIIAVIAIMTVSITVAVSNTIKYSKLRTFATEIAFVQSEYKSYVKKTNSLDYIISDISLNLSDVPNSIKSEQFLGEDIGNNTLLLHVLDLKILGIDRTAYGNGEDALDFYAVSDKTGKVYYVKGYDATKTTYYTITDELLDLVEELEERVDSKTDVIFIPSAIGWTNGAVSVKVKIPGEATAISVVADNGLINVSNNNLVDGYYEIDVNSSNSVAGNYVVSVNYTLGGNTKAETYSVNGYDDVAPVVADVTTSNLSQMSTAYVEKVYVFNISATDDISGVKKLLYVFGDNSTITSKEFFEKNGIEITNNKFGVPYEAGTYTIYAEDKAGNYSLKAIKVKIVGTETLTVLGESFVELPGSTGENVIDYKIYGNSNQAVGVLAPGSPIPVISLGESGSIEVVSNGKNLFSKFTVENKKIIDPSDGTSIATNNASDNGSDYIVVGGNTDYYITNVARRRYGAWYDSNKTFISGIISYGAVTSPANAKYCRLTITTDRLDDFQMELGSAATDYVPYQVPTTATIDLTGHEPLRKIGKIVDYVDFANNSIQRNIMSVDMGTLNWRYNTSVAGKEYFYVTNLVNIKPTLTTTEVANILGSCFTPDTANNVYKHKIDNSISIEKRGYAYCYCSAYADATSFKAAMSGQMLYYEVATPYPEPITLPTVQTHSGYNKISVSGPVSPSKIIISYMKYILSVENT